MVILQNTSTEAAPTTTPPATEDLELAMAIIDSIQEIAEKLYESVAASLEGKKMASFTRISSAVKVCGFSPKNYCLKLMYFASPCLYFYLKNA